MLLEKSIKFFLNLVDSNANNIVQDIFIISTEDIQKDNIWWLESADTAKTDSNIEENIQNVHPRSIFKKSHEHL